MKLSNLHLMGRYKHRITGKTVNIHKGRNMQRGTDHLFYYKRGKRVFITPVDFYSTPRDWELLPTIA